MEPEQIKADLRAIRRYSHTIEVLLGTKKRYEQRLEIAKQCNDDNAEQIEHIIASLNVDEYVKQAAAIEKKYIDAIKRLSPLDQSIIIDGYFNNKTYFQIGWEIGYSEAGVKKRVRRIIELLAEMV